MAIILVPKPRGVMKPDRTVSSLLKTQVQHLQEAERNLPAQYRSERYIHAIRTEGEAAEYVREVTEAIHKAHEDAAARRKKQKPARRGGLDIAAVAATPSAKRDKVKTKAKRSGRRSKKK